MILDTIGFSGTHSISHILENYSKNTYVVHGSKNPFTKDKMGKNNLSEYEFLKSIKALENIQNKSGNMWENMRKVQENIGKM